MTAGRICWPPKQQAISCSTGPTAPAGSCPSNRGRSVTAGTSSPSPTPRLASSAQARVASPRKPLTAGCSITASARACSREAAKWATDGTPTASSAEAAGPAEAAVQTAAAEAAVGRPEPEQRAAAVLRGVLLQQPPWQETAPQKAGL